FAEVGVKFVGDVGEYATVIAQHIAPGGSGVFAFEDPAANEKVGIAVVVDVGACRAGCRCADFRYRTGGQGEISLTVVVVKSVHCGLPASGPCAGDVQVGIAVIVGIKKQGASVIALAGRKALL